MATTTFMILLVGVLILGIILTVFIDYILDENNFYKTHCIPLKFAVKDVVYPDGEISHQLYYKRFLFWHPYRRYMGDYRISFIGDWEAIDKEVQRVISRRRDHKKSRDENRFWKHKMTRIW